VLVSCWSVKGGSGTTVVATSLALVLARSSPAGSDLVDRGAAAPAVLGLPEPDGPGVSDWLEAGAGVPTDGWARLEVGTPSGVAVVPRGRGPLRSVDRAEVLAGLLAAERRPVVVDCGVVPTGPAAFDHAPAVLASQATRSILVLRPCYLALRRAEACPFRPSHVVLVHEPWRVFAAADIEAVLGADVCAEIPLDPAVARAVDAGSFGRRLPRALQRSLRAAA
jgi:hypothetical protein